jgi:VIT1/CCC1 family predicted Fe2+/Mn2+ transporter
MRSKQTVEAYIRNFIFGIEDGLVSTVGLLSGIAAADVPRTTIVLTGVVLVIVEAFSMGVGSLLSESSAEEYVLKKTSLRRTASAATIMFVSYLVAGMIPLFPYFFASDGAALVISVGASLVALFVLGFVSARRFNISGWRSGIRMFVLGGIAIAAGVLVGRWLK